MRQQGEGFYFQSEMPRDHEIIPLKIKDAHVENSFSKVF